MRVQAIVIILALLGVAPCQAFGPCPQGTEMVEGRTGPQSYADPRLGLTYDQTCSGGRCPATWCANPLGGELVKHGRFRSRHHGGQRNAEGHYRDGKRHGRWAAWFPSGQRRYKGQWRDDRKIGAWTAWHENGTISSQATFKDNMLDGLYTAYFPNGRKILEWHYANGREVGIWKFWNEDGTFQAEIEKTSPVAD